MRCLNLIDFPYKLAIMSFVCFFFSPPRMLCYSSYTNMKSSKKGGGSHGCLETKETLVVLLRGG